MALYKREKELVLKIRSPVHPLARDGGAGRDLPPDARPRPLQDRVRAAARRREQPAGARSPAGDTIYLNLRSILQIMTFLSKGVCVPEEHVRDGEAPTTPGPDGRPFDWTAVTAGNFFVASQKHRPAATPRSPSTTGATGSSSPATT